MRYSYSSVNMFKQCPFKWYLKYGTDIETTKDLNHDNPLLIGTLLHDTIEYGLDYGIQKYYDEFPIIQNEHVEEVIKVMYFYKKIKDILPDGIIEYEIKTDDFIGYIDLLTDTEIWDIKYSNNTDINTMQLHLYKYYIELTTDRRIDKLKYLFVPKTSIKKRFDESIYDFRKRLDLELSTMDIEVVEIKYNPDKVKQFFDIIDYIESDDAKLTKNYTPLCNWCDYEKICMRNEIKA